MDRSITPPIANGTVESLRTLRRMVTPRQTYAVLVGSGLSKAAGMLSGEEFMMALLSEIGRDLEPRGVIERELCKLAQPKPNGRLLRFEVLMQTILDSHDPELTLLRMFEKPQVSSHRQHIILAELARQRHLVCTTNFDSLIEHALLGGVRQPPHDIAQIYTNAAFARWCRRPQYDPVPIFKLHGTLERHARSKWFSARRSIQAAIYQVGLQGQGFAHARGKKEFLEKTLEKHDLIVLGYSWERRLRCVL